ncbi:hypothetical protein H5410_051755 [Solanum commersonii]|uniref:DUF4283 domain-containing protein n=1 Tax=Solanum commersonii TaxID=4109 RepID=A0A9J5X1Y4_SOLCO|nr:hypothetical protein H5410_051755 [Solanum commersonii]
MAMMALGQPPPMEVGLTISMKAINKPTYVSTIKPAHPSCKYVPLKQISCLHGEPRIVWEEDEVNQMIINEDLQCTVIEKFSYGWREIQELRRMILKQCELKEEVNIGLLRNRYILIRDTLLEDYVSSLSKPQFYITHKHWSYPMRTLKWDPLFDQVEVTAVGKPLQVDLATQNRTSCARVKVEVDLLGNFPKRINLGMKTKECFVIHPELYQREEGENQETKKKEGEKGIQRSDTLTQKEQEKLSDNNDFQEQRGKKVTTTNKFGALEGKHKEESHKERDNDRKGDPSRGTSTGNNTIEERNKKKGIGEKAETEEHPDIGDSQIGEKDNSQSQHVTIPPPKIDKLSEKERIEIQKREEDENMDRNIDDIGRKGDLSPRKINHLKGKIDSVQQVTIRFKRRGLNDYFIITVVYAMCSALKRLELWEQLEEIVGNSTIPWLVGGIFNTMMDESEKLGGLHVTQMEIADFVQL